MERVDVLKEMGKLGLSEAFVEDAFPVSCLHVALDFDVLS